MVDRVHPEGGDGNMNNDVVKEQGPNKFEEESVPATSRRPKSGTYVIQVPKDQIYRVPPPENAHLFESYSRRGTSRSRRIPPCCRCVAWTLATLLLILLSLAVTAAVLYLAFQPKLPSYSLDRIAIKGLNLSTTSSTPLSPKFDITVRADNSRNRKVGIQYYSGAMSVSYSGVDLCRGSWPMFYQPRRNVTVFRAVLQGSGVLMSGAARSALLDQQRRRRVPLLVDADVPVKVRFGAVSSWTVTVKVACSVEVDELTEEARIVSRSCSTKIDV